MMGLASRICCSIQECCPLTAARNWRISLVDSVLPAPLSPLCVRDERDGDESEHVCAGGKHGQQGHTEGNKNAANRGTQRTMKMQPSGTQKAMKMQPTGTHQRQ